MKTLDGFHLLYYPFRDLKTLILTLSTAFGAGLVPKAPGTVGSLVGVLLWFATLPLPLWGRLLVMFVLFGVSVWASEQACRIYNKKDDQRIVIDEVIGQYIALIQVTTWPMALVGFVLFRILDIVKLYPANWVDQHMKTGLGVVLDDVVSGYYAWAIVMLIQFLMSLA